MAHFVFPALELGQLHVLQQVEILVYDNVLIFTRKQTHLARYTICNLRVNECPPRPSFLWKLVYRSSLGFRDVAALLRTLVMDRDPSIEVWEWHACELAMLRHQLFQQRLVLGTRWSDRGCPPVKLQTNMGESLRGVTWVLYVYTFRCHLSMALPLVYVYTHNPHANIYIYD